MSDHSAIRRESFQPTSDDLVRDPIGSYPPATVAALDPTAGNLPRRSLDVERTQGFLQRLALAGTPAVLVAASTGHGHLRTVDELDEWFHVAADARAESLMLMALLRPEDGEAANRRLAGVLRKLNYPVVFVRPGNDLSRDASDEAIAANMSPAINAIADAGLAVGVYSIPDVSGLPLRPAAVAQLLATSAGERIVAVKVTEANYEQSTQKFLADPRLNRLKIVQGWDPHLAAALQDGPRYDAGGRQRAGVTSGPVSFAVLQYMHIFSAASQGDWAEVQIAQAAVTALFQSMQDDPTKFADLQRAKYLMGLGHPLTGEVRADQVERVLDALEKLPRAEDRQRLALSLNLMEDGPFAERLRAI